MSVTERQSKLEDLKESSRQLRGTLDEELANDSDEFTGDSKQLLKFHGSYQQDDRDLRNAKNPDGTAKGKTYSCMVRTRIPGGKVTAEQFLAELDLCEKYGNGTLRVTTRQALQLHGVVKSDLKATIRAINETMLTTLAACGDVERNVMCCPAPYKNNAVRQQMQEMADAVAELLKPRTTSYYEIWLEDDEGGKTDVTEFKPVDEPIYGTRYLPRKFKTSFALPEDNCVDLLSNDLGFLGVVENETIVGYNVYVGGGMGITPAKKETFPAVAKKMTYVTPDQVLAVAEAIVKVQRDFGNRANRALARMKYLVADWGVERFKSKVEEYFGAGLPDPHPIEICDIDDHMGWHEQGDGKWFLGINIENGRIKDDGTLRLKSGLRTILEKYRMPARLTARQAVILCDITPDQREDINNLLAEYGIAPVEEMTPARRFSMACPALPTCGLSVTESERVMPRVMDDIERELDRHGLIEERIAVHMTGCPNGCTRPYSPDVGLVGKARGKYTVYLGGNLLGTRMAFIYKDLVPLEEIGLTLSPILAYYKQERTPGELFGDFCERKGVADLLQYAEQNPVSSYTYEDVAKMIDHSLLQPVLTDQELEDGCKLAAEYGVASVCIKPYYVKRCAELLAGSGVEPSTTIGFPHGGHTTAMKVAESEQALDDGATELDMVVNIGKVLSGDWEYVEQDIQAVVEVTHARGGIVKVIFENCYLDDAQKIRLCEICAAANADFVKTSSGYGSGGATIDDLKLMRQHSPKNVQVKAAGGIRTFEALLEARSVGVTRVGATRTAEILDECRRQLEG